MSFKFLRLNMVTTANVGGRWQFRLRGSYRKPALAEFWRSAKIKI
jgi:hypothetical protein